jgi:hypothetical protein
VILSTYMKFINLFDDLAPIIINVFDHYRYCDFSSLYLFFPLFSIFFINTRFFEIVLFLCY